MSDELDAIVALAADYNPTTASLSPDTLAVFMFAGTWLQSRWNWVNKNNPLDEVTDTEWLVIQEMVATAFKEIFINMIGQVMYFANANFPPNILPCDGATYSRVDYPDLYAEMDSAFIVDADTFRVPDLSDRVVMNESSSRAVGDSGGEETHTLTEAQMPAHQHTIPQLVDTPFVTPGEDVFGATIVPVISALTGFAGGGSAHNNMQPYIVLKAGIVAF